MKRFESLAPPLTDKERDHVAFCLEAGMDIDNIIALIVDRRNNIDETFGEVEPDE